MVVPWPPIHFVALCTTMSAPHCFESVCVVIRDHHIDKHSSTTRDTHLDRPADGTPCAKCIVDDEGHAMLDGQGLELIEARDVVLDVYMFVMGVD
jgi:hypothetical protein